MGAQTKEPDSKFLQEQLIMHQWCLHGGSGIMVCADLD